MDRYKQLQKILDTHPSTAPESDYFDEILRLLFTPEEAGIALHMSFKLKPLSDIAASAGLKQDEAGEILESMTDRCIIYSKKKEANVSYGLLPTIPGLFEFPFMKGITSEKLERLAVLWEEYHKEALGNSFSGSPTPLMRVIPVEKSFTAENRVHPYEEVATFIEKAKFISVTNCACRVSVEGCDRPKEVCLVFDSAGEFLAEKGFARKIDRAEAMRVLDTSDKAGLVHTSNNSRDRANLICNCCPCCCTVLRGLTQLENPNAFSTSGFAAKIKDDLCTGCGICADERCPVNAIDMVSGIAVISETRCIGCGLCATGCPVSAIDMINRQTPPEIPATVQEMGLKVVSEKGRLQDFIRVMGK